MKTTKQHIINEIADIQAIVDEYGSKFDEMTIPQTEEPKELIEQPKQITININLGDLDNLSKINNSEKVKEIKPLITNHNLVKWFKK